MYVMRLMRNKKIYLAAFMLLVGCSMGSKGLKDFQSDGCSLFIDRSLINEEDWCQCCFEHDVLYWQGGSEEQRALADNALKECVLEKTGNEQLAEMMYLGVRVGGSPYFYNWYRWGYGWGYERKYKKLTPEEEKIVKKKLARYYNSFPSSPCSAADQIP